MSGGAGDAPSRRAPARSAAEVGAEPSTANKVAWLASAAKRAAAAAQVIETRTSWVFLAGEHVLKLKKPTRSPGPDLSTVVARETNARAELALNRALAPEIYLGLVPLVHDGRSGLAFGGAGRVVDWLVAMRRLPATRMLDAALLRGSASGTDLERLATRLARFYAAQPSAGRNVAERLAALRREHRRDRRTLLDPRVGPLPARVHRLLDTIGTVLDDPPGWLLARAAEGRVIEGHGDLRAEHVCLIDPPVVIDRLEFDRALRLRDPFEELAALALECARLGASRFGVRLIAEVARRLDDRPPPPLLAFHAACGGCLRARLALDHLRAPPPVRRRARWRPLALGCLRLAAQAIAAIESPRHR